ncbi:hypothetical protein AUC68_12560 [Methyloceanibacter methanicus]|uniref:DUF2244 domain-containing protein n=1 Tax=Methyloceanibacter methanicus TaxID=1774968 RepID=A0A1E3W640_9HYPH|nr:DUF2244 domain-containing protein [Methyloceanibacter methanicus]ODS01269.1 hypothetical protein AUC68_12560 [Methyloceanibacter methanicus]
MTETHPLPQGPDNPEPSFRAVLTPHRSLGPRGFVIFMLAVSTISFGTGLLFFLMGAWPVVGFMGLDVLLIYVAFRINFRALRVYETVALTGDALTVTRVAPDGREQSWQFNPYWVRVRVDERVGLSSELSLASHGKRLIFGAFLTDPEREDFADALKDALREVRAPDTGQTAFA